MKSNLKILIVEDEVITATAIKSELKEMGYTTVSIAINYNKAMKNIQENSPDLILLDIDLKGEYTDIDIANEKEVLNKIPVIYITGNSNSKTRDDIIASNPKKSFSKPIRFDDLEVAISLALKNKIAITNIGYDFTYDFAYGTLFMKDIPIKLSKNEKKLLEQLIENHGKTVPTEILEFEIWGNEPMSKSAIRTLIRNLKNKLNPKMIKNTLGVGYKLNLLGD